MKVAYYMLPLVGTCVLATPASAQRVTPQFALARARSQPNAIKAVATGYDEARQEGLAFGGVGMSSLVTGFADTHSWDGTRWRQRFPSTVPPGRYWARMAWDPNTRCVMMYGGYDGSVFGSNYRIYADTWLWNGSDWQYAGLGPPARQGPAMATDPGRRRIVLFGGLNMLDTWEWDGIQWTQIFPARTPAGHYFPAMTWNPATRRVAMFSRTTVSARLLPVEEWDGSNWHAIPGTIVGGPTPTNVLASAVPDPDNRGVLVFGLNGSQGASLPVQTWLWDGASLIWQQPALAQPIRLSVDSLFLDKARREIVLYAGTDFVSGGYGDAHDTAVTSTTKSAWHVRESGGGTGPFGNQAVATHIPWDDSFLITTQDQKIWRRTDAGQSLVGPGPLLGPVFLMPDPDRLVLYALNTGLGYLYQLNGTTWTLIPAAQHGIPAQCFPAGYDASDHTFVMVNSSTIKKWNGSSVTTVATIPVSNSQRGIAYDPDRHAVCVLVWAGALPPTLFEWDGSSWHTGVIPGPVVDWHLYFFPGVGWALSEYSSPANQMSWDGTTFAPLVLNLPLPLTTFFIQGSAVDVCRNRLRLQRVAEDLADDDFWDVYPANLDTSNPEPRPGTSFTLSVTSQPHAGQPWLLGLSPATYPGIPLDGLQPNPFRVLPLAPDPMLIDTLSSGIRGTLDAQGAGSISIQVPNRPELVGFRVFACAVSLQSWLQLGLISRPVELYVAP